MLTSGYTAMELDGGAIISSGPDISMDIRAHMSLRELGSFTSNGRTSMESGAITNGIRIAGTSINFIATLGRLEPGAAITGPMTGATTGNV